MTARPKTRREAEVEPVRERQPLTPAYIQALVAEAVAKDDHQEEGRC